MTWQLQDFNNPNRVKVLLTKLSQSPLVRKSLPNAATIMGQYFAFKRGRNEPISTFLIREALHYEEFRECLVHLKEEKLGLGPDRNGFGLPQMDDSSETEGVEAATDSTPGATSPTREARERRDATEGRSSEYHRIPQQEPEEETVLSMSDSFILEQLRGWRLLTSASLNPEEWRDVLGTTQGKLDYQSVSDALQMLYDEQMTGASRHQGVPYPGHQLNFNEQFDDADDWWSSSWDSWSPSYDDYWNHAVTSWDEDWSWPWHGQGEEDGDDHGPPDGEETGASSTQPTSEAAQMEQLLQEQRSWSQAHKATAAMKKDRGFGKTGCYLRGSPGHFAKDCPDRFAPRGKGRKGMHFFEEEDWAFAMTKGKGKSKGKSKDVHFANKGKSSSPWYFKGKGKEKGKGGVNAYSLNAMNYYGLDVELQAQEKLAPDLKTKVMGPECGMIDSGATCSAGPETSVQRLISTIMAADSGADIKISKKDPPRFRYGSGKWGQALYKVTVSSSLSGTPRSFSCFALPDPEEIKEEWFQPHMLVPVLVGMDSLQSAGVGAIIDFTDGHCCLAGLDGSVMQLPTNYKHHFFLDVVHYLTQGNVRHGESVHVVVELDDGVGNASQEEGQILELLPLQQLWTHDMKALQLFVHSSTGPSESFQMMCHRRSGFQLMGIALRDAIRRHPLLPVIMAPKTTTKDVTKDLDMERTIGADPRDPRYASTTWPCFGNHIPSKDQSNKYAMWRHCTKCDLRLTYVPKKGSPCTHTSTTNPADILKALNELKSQLPPEVEPNAALVKAMHEKVVATERMTVMLQEYQKAWDTNK